MPCLIEKGIVADQGTRYFSDSVSPDFVGDKPGIFKGDARIAASLDN